MDSISFAEKRKNARKPHKQWSLGKKRTRQFDGFVNEASGSRTPNTQIKSLVLYQLS